MQCRLQKSFTKASPRNARVSLPRPVKLTRATSVAERPLIEKKEEVAKAEEKEFVHEVAHPIVSTKEAVDFINTLVEDTDIVDLHLQVGSFELRVRRSTANKGASAAAPALAPAEPAAAAPAAAPVETSATPVVSLDASIDESLVYVSSPKVGTFRRGKYAAGKRVGKGNCVNEREQVKRGQALGYIEQLGTYFPVESPQAGEAIKFLVEEGAPVEFQQLIVEVAPFFGGHIIGDNKHV